jgi:hypothetical protein
VVLQKKHFPEQERANLPLEVVFLNLAFKKRSEAHGRATDVDHIHSHNTQRLSSIVSLVAIATNISFLSYFISSSHSLPKYATSSNNGT